jgi:methylenetetrahydrofolate reductase (NADPH)
MNSDDNAISSVQLAIPPGHVSPGRLERLLREGTFVVTTEISPPDSADPREVYERAKVFDGYVDAMNATDGSGGNCHMSSLGMCSLLALRGYDMVMQMTGRDRNRIAIQADILSAAALGIANVLCLTGDDVAGGDHPDAKPVFDVDGMSMLSMLRGMRDDRQYLSGRELTEPPHVLLGAAENPFAPPLDDRLGRLEDKISAGAQFVQTQYCFDMEVLDRFMAGARDQGLHEKLFIILGVGPLASAKSAEWIRANIPGVHIPDAIIRRLSDAMDQAQEGVNICIEIVQKIREIEGVAGAHIMAYRQEHRVPEIVEKSAVLDGRAPWHPPA